MIYIKHGIVNSNFDNPAIPKESSIWYLNMLMLMIKYENIIFNEGIK